MRESEVLHDVLLAVSALPDVFVWRQNVGAAQDRRSGQVVTFGIPGCADVLCVVGPAGRFVAIETKKPRGGKHGEAQKVFQAAVERVGGVYRLARSAEEALAAIAEARG